MTIDALASNNEIQKAYGVIVPVITPIDSEEKVDENGCKPAPASLFHGNIR